MKNTIGYKGIDNFRIIAAILVITVHTSPLELFAPTADFILTRVIARTAVPFFFMTTGFFLLSDGCSDAQSSLKLKKFLKKTLVIYLASILLYLPLNIYNSYFSSPDLFLKVLKDLIFDGTFYHLWYLPASILGALIVFFTVRAAGYKKALVIFLLLYITGLFGDSYYGAISGIAPLKDFYNGIFAVSDYTRNGVFFAPLFMLLGGMAGKRERTVKKKCPADDRKYEETEENGALFNRRKNGARVIACAAASFALMLAEALLLRRFGLQRHDSMYVFLVPLMWFLFGWTVRFKGVRKSCKSRLALIVYIIHPITIVAVRAEAKMLGLERLLIDNGIVHFLAVCVCSFAEGAGLLLLREIFFGGKGKHIKKKGA